MVWPLVPPSPIADMLLTRHDMMLRLLLPACRGVAGGAFAVKRMFADCSEVAEHGASLQRLVRLAGAWRQLVHPQLVIVHGLMVFPVVGSSLHVGIVSDWVSGGTLKQVHSSVVVWLCYWVLDLTLLPRAVCTSGCCRRFGNSRGVMSVPSLAILPLAWCTSTAQRLYMAP